MRYIMPPRCICGKISSFGFEDKKPTHCKECKTSGMRNVKSKKCPCGKQPSFGLVKGKPTHCKECKTSEMTDVTNKKCLCGKQPSFGLVKGKPTHCKECRTPDMIDVRSKRCPCGNRPSFGIVDGKPTHCNECRTPDMKNVIANMCPCGKQPSFGLVKGHPTHCKECKTGDMKNVKDKMCQCGHHPSFGLVEGQPTHCKECKTNNMNDVINKRCQGYNGVPCPTDYLIGRGREYCLACDPDDSRRLDRKRDEAAFFNFLNKTDIAITQREFPVHYRCFDTNKTMAFVDGIIVTKDVVVCMELDEDAHETYDKGCEEARMHNVSAELKIAFPNHSIAWVRVNPHTKKNGKRDMSARALKLRDKRHQEALKIIKDILQHPKDCIEYVGYDV
ncbi:hypothetical protein ATCVCan0610SP_929R [Acanthocystis turfacea Chlorella virus Can0610SP]|nr:hypothetical protein ATCVCan0610SP_929R [Acanthocystis turfacea Chlorella virus Can0610SP]